MVTDIRMVNRACTDEKQIKQFLEDAQTAFLGLVDQHIPYVIPLNYVYKDGIFYFHGANEGRKIDILTTNQNACMTISENYGTMVDPVPAETDTAYMSVVANGLVEIVTDLNEATAAMQAMLDKYVPDYYHAPLSKKHLDKYQSSLGSKTLVLKVKPTSITAKEHKLNEQMQYYSGREVTQDMNRKSIMNPTN
ncbi:pyridoxamine 5'-phosphate oxidase family protein [Lysinibacillus sp. FSL K6-0075]|jgi:nitroimidazol reductase NimA-like FMN-containing flavoprotein (pyridoxamine 5'-phosphate oxidase superfamily)|uniref:pyridoxamine 5'-phosphate oxidase family protein n=1 Tax=Lysinibacillus sp. FSL K6-0075 TaxID=2921415 RepID=UPI00315984E2